jgi:hypothetical protein
MVHYMTTANKAAAATTDGISLKRRMSIKNQVSFRTKTWVVLTQALLLLFVAVCAEGKFALLIQT